MRSRPATLSLWVLVLGACFAHAQEFSSSPPRDVTPGVATANQRWPAVAAGKDAYLVVWQDGDLMAGEKKVSIVAARMGADGKPLDAAGIAVCDADGLRGYPSVAFDGGNWIVAWQDYRTGQDWDLYAARVSPEGKVLDPHGFVVAEGKGNQIYPTVASDNTGASLIAWSDVRPGFEPELYRLYGAFLRDGKPAHAFEIAKGGTASLLDPRMAWDGEAYALVANEGAPDWQPCKPRAYRIAPDGRVSPWPLAGFLGAGYSFCSEAEGMRSCVVSAEKTEHGIYRTAYLVNVAQGANTGTRHALAGLQESHPPRNDLWTAVTFDGKNFVLAMEQTDYAGTDRPSAPSVWLAASRVNPGTAATLDLPSAPAEGVDTDMRNPKKTTAYKEAVERGKTQQGLRAVYEKEVQLRHPALASLGGGKSLLVYSRHGGVGQYKIHATLLSE